MSMSSETKLRQRRNVQIRMRLEPENEGCVEVREALNKETSSEILGPYTDPNGSAYQIYDVGMTNRDVRELEFQFCMKKRSGGIMVAVGHDRYNFSFREVSPGEDSQTTSNYDFYPLSQCLIGVSPVQLVTARTATTEVSDALWSILDSEGKVWVYVEERPTFVSCKLPPKSIVKLCSVFNYSGQMEFIPNGMTSYPSYYWGPNSSISESPDVPNQHTPFVIVLDEDGILWRLTEDWEPQEFFVEEDGSSPLVVAWEHTRDFNTNSKSWIRIDKDGTCVAQYTDNDFNTILAPYLMCPVGDEWGDCAVSLNGCIALTKAGRMFVIGYDNYGHLGLDYESGSLVFTETTTHVWVEITKVSTLGIQKVFTGMHSTALISSSGLAYMGGYFSNLPFGTEVKSSTVDFKAIPGRWSIIDQWGPYYTTGIHIDGTMWGWGSSLISLLEYSDSFEDSDYKEPMMLSMDSDWSTISGIDRQTFGLKFCASEEKSPAIIGDESNGRWGVNYEYETPQKSFKSLPFKDTIAVASSSDHTLLVDSSGALWGAGLQDGYVFGTPNEEEMPIMSIIDTPAPVVNVWSEYKMSYILCDDGVLYATGYNIPQVDGSATMYGWATSWSIIPLPGKIQKVTLATTGEGGVAGYLLTNGEFYVHGDNISKNLGLGEFVSDSISVLTKVAGVYQDVCLSEYGGIAVSISGSLYTWGVDHFSWGQWGWGVGTYSQADHFVPKYRIIPGYSGKFTKASARGHHASFAVGVDGKLYGSGAIESGHPVAMTHAYLTIANADPTKIGTYRDVCIGTTEGQTIDFYNLPKVIDVRMIDSGNTLILLEDTSVWGIGIEYYSEDPFPPP